MAAWSQAIWCLTLIDFMFVLAYIKNANPRRLSRVGSYTALLILFSVFIIAGSRVFAMLAFAGIYIPYLWGILTGCS